MVKRATTGHRAYDKDYSAEFEAKSLVTKEWVEANAGGSTDPTFSDSRWWSGNIVAERPKLKVSWSNVGTSLTVTPQFVGANTSYRYRLLNKEYIITPANIANYAKTATIGEGLVFFYISRTTTDAANPVIVLSNTAWSILDGHCLLWIFKFNATTNTVTNVMHEKHAYDRGDYWHKREHDLGALYKSGMLASMYNGITNAALQANTDNNYGRAMITTTDGQFEDEDLPINIEHTDASINATLATAATDWNGTTKQFLGFTVASIAGTNTTTIVFPSTRTLVTGQPLLVMAGNTTTARGTVTVTAGGSNTTFTVSTLAGMTTGDVIIASGKRPIYYINSNVGGVYTWRELPSGFLTAVMSGAVATTANIASGVPQFNNPAGGFSNMTANRHFCLFEIATNFIHEPIGYILSQGQSTGSTLSTSLTESFANFLNLQGLSALAVSELCVTKRLTCIYNTTGAFSNTRVKIVDVTTLNLRINTVNYASLLNNQTAVVREVNRVYLKTFGAGVQLPNPFDTNPLMPDIAGNDTSLNGGYQNGIGTAKGIVKITEPYNKVRISGLVRPYNIGAGNPAASGTPITFTVHFIDTTATGRVVVATTTFTVATTEALNQNQGQNGANTINFTTTDILLSTPLVEGGIIGISVTCPTAWGVIGDLLLNIKYIRE
jgi:hypothetical protein